MAMKAIEASVVFLLYLLGTVWPLRDAVVAVVAVATAVAIAHHRSYLFGGILWVAIGIFVVSYNCEFLLFFWY